MNIEKKVGLVTALIVFFASLPRGVELVSGNYLFGFDQGLFLEAVKSIVVDRKLTLIGAEVGGQGGFFQGPGWYYLLTIPFILTGGNPYGAMVLMFLIGMATVFFAIVLGRRLFGHSTGLLIGFLIAVSPGIIAQSRFIWPPFPVSLLAVFILFFLYKVLEKKEKFLPLLALGVGFLFHFEVATGVTLFAQLLLFSLVLLFKRLVSVRTFLLSIGSFVLILSPLILFDLRHQFIISKGVMKLFLGGGSTGHEVTLLYIQSMFFNHLNAFRFHFLSVFQLSSILWPLLLFLLIFGGIVYLKDKKQSFAKKAFVLYLMLSPLALFVVFMAYLWPMWEWWILELGIFYCFLLGIILSYLWKNMLFRPIIIGVIMLFFIAFINQTMHFYKTDFFDYGGTAKIRGKIDAIDTIYQDAKGEKFGLLIFTPPVYTYPYDYLLWWHGQKKYNYLPHREKRGIIYLLIEPDPHKPWTYKGWLETVIRDGEILETKELPSGFIIQKRKMDEKI